MWPFAKHDERVLRVTMLTCLEAAEGIASSAMVFIRVSRAAAAGVAPRDDTWSYHARVVAAILAFNYTSPRLKRWEAKRAPAILIDQVTRRWGDRAARDMGYAGDAIAAQIRRGVSPAEAAASCLMAGADLPVAFDPDLVAAGAVIFSAAKRFGGTGEWRS